MADEVFQDAFSTFDELEDDLLRRASARLSEMWPK
jgi:hypothetical protein